MSKLGIIGCGWIVEKAYLPLIAKMNDVDISAVFDIDYHKAHKLQDKYCIPNIFDNIDCFLSSPLDAVIVATPNNTHTYYSDMALNAGKHVLCEKPVAFSKNDIESTTLMDHEQSSGRWRSNNRYWHPCYRHRFAFSCRQTNSICKMRSRNR